MSRACAWMLVTLFCGACSSSAPPATGSSVAGSAGRSEGGHGGAGRSAGGAGSAGRSAGGAGSAGRSEAGRGGAGASALAGSRADAGTITDWRMASLTNFTSYPDPGSDECVKFNGCMWAGQFAGVDGTQTEAWVMAHNIVAVHSKDFAQYKLKTLRLRKDGKQIDVTVYDECADSDCSGCCTQNAKPSGFLIDVEKYTAQRFGVEDGQVEWACLDCN
jgi:hypothetical protein